MLMLCHIRQQGTYILFIRIRRPTNNLLHNADSSMPRAWYLIRLPARIHRRARCSRIAIMLILLSVMCILITPLYLVYQTPNFLIRYFQRRWPDVLWRVSTSSKITALTVDDGPSEYTDEIMQILKKNCATATFFIIGSQIEGYKETLQHLIRDGNELGNHAMHDEPSRSLHDATLVDQIQSGRDASRGICCCWRRVSS
jgi:hypothetical protein